MKRAILGVVLLLPALACDTPSAHKSGVSFTAAGTGSGAGGTSGQATSGTGAGGSSGAAGTSGAAASGASSAGATSGSVASSGGAAGSTGSCFPTGTYVGAGQDAQCCTGMATADGYCTDTQSATTGAGSTGGVGTTGGGTTSAGTTTGTVATGTTTGGTCPANMPNINSGAVQNPVACNSSHSSESCPKGFHCDNGYCILNGGASPLQITLSFDDAEDLDLHVREPKPSGGYCEIYYANPGPVPQPDGGLPGLPFDAGFSWPPIFDAGFGFPTPSSCSVGWLDRDANAGCQASNMDGINIENVFYPNNQPAPSGTYSVYLDYWEDCDQIAMSNYAIQVRVNGATYVYCGTVNQSQADNGGAGSGFLITTFTIP